MKRNKIMALAMLCSTFLSPVSKAHGGTKQSIQKSDTQSDSDKNLKNTKNKKSDNPQEMYNLRWKTNDIVKYIKYVLGTIVIGGGSIYVGKKGYNKYIRNPKIKIEEIKEIEEIKKIKKIKPEKIIEEIKEIKEIKPKEKLTRDSIAKKIRERFGSGIFNDKNTNVKIMRKAYKKVVENYKVQKGNEFQQVIETEIPKDKQDNEQFITWFQELNTEALDIILEGFSDEEKQFAKDNFKFYSFVWVNDYVYFSIAFAPKEKEIDLDGRRGEVACDFTDEQLFGHNYAICLQLCL